MSRGITVSAARNALPPSRICASCLVVALMVARPVPADAGDKLVLQLHRAAQFEFAGYYAALWQGFYRDAGLDIEIRRGSAPTSSPSGPQDAGSGPTDPVREVTEGRAQFGTGTTQLIVRAAQGLPLLLVA